MAWDALAGVFAKKKTPDQQDRGLFDQRANLSPGTTGSVGADASSTPQAIPNGGFGGTGGSDGNSGSANFVNYGTLYGANQEKAKSMANNVYRGAETAADKATNSLQDAQNQFNTQAHQGTATAPIGGAHGTQVFGAGAASGAAGAEPQPGRKGNDVSTDGAGPGSWLNGKKYDANGNAIDENQPTNGSVQDFTYGTPGYQLADNQARVGTGTNAGASRYAGLYGQTTGLPGEHDPLTGAPQDYNPGLAPGIHDYHAGANILDAKSHAGGGYTGPKSLEDMMGADAYAKESDDLRKAQDQVNATGTAGGIAQSLGYTGGNQPQGMSALDTGLTQTAGQSNFKTLRDRYAGLNNLLPQAQADSLKTADAGAIQSDANAKAWQALLDEYDTKQKAASDAESGKLDGRTPDTYNSNGKDYFQLQQDQDSHAAHILGESGYTATELNNIYFDLTPEERAYLEAGDNLFDNLTNYGTDGKDATMKQNILAKLAKRRAADKAKNGGQ